VDAAGNVYIADKMNQRVRKVAAATGIITTVAGTGAADYGGDGGPAANAILSSPSAVAVDAAGNLYIADSGNNRVRKVAAPVK
jgi:trimeric autotransporter adhesin